MFPLKKVRIVRVRLINLTMFLKYLNFEDKMKFSFKLTVLLSFQGNNGFIVFFFLNRNEKLKR